MTCDFITLYDSIYFPGVNANNQSTALNEMNIIHFDC